MFRSIPFFVFISGLLLIIGCEKDVEIPQTDPAVQLETDIKLIKDYLVANGLSAQETASGLHYIVEEKGSGDFIELNAETNLLLKGYFLDGEVFDQTDDCFPVTMVMSNVIEGFQEGIQKFNVGGKGTILIPSGLAFGQNGNGTIPVNSVLIFDVEIIDQKVFDKNKILTYLEENNLTADTTLSGIYYIIDTPGEGRNPTSSSTVTVSYRGFFANGRVFDERGFQTFSLGSVIQGWKEAIPLLKPGGSGTFFIPSNLGYGPTGTSGIPGNAMLIFEVKLEDFN